MRLVGAILTGSFYFSNFHFFYFFKKNLTYFCSKCNQSPICAVNRAKYLITGFFGFASVYAMKRKISSKAVLPIAIVFSTACFLYVNLHATWMRHHASTAIELLETDDITVTQKEKDGGNSHIAPAIYLFRLAGKLLSVPR